MRSNRTRSSTPSSFRSIVLNCAALRPPAQARRISSPLLLRTGMVWSNMYLNCARKVRGRSRTKKHSRRIMKIFLLYLTQTHAHLLSCRGRKVAPMVLRIKLRRFKRAMSTGIENLYAQFSESGLVSTDTRKITPGSVFFALKGDKFNANEFAAEALQKGASWAVIDEEKFKKDDRYIVVGNVLETLQKLARHHRDQLHIPVVALTGSNGKTTTKELTYAVLATKYKTLATKGNLNNHIGVPLTVLSIDRS